MVLFIIIALGYLSILGKQILSPLLFGLLLSILLFPVARFIEHRGKLRRNAACGTTVLLLVFILSGVIFLVSTEISRLSQNLPMLEAQLMASLHNFQQWISDTFHVDIVRQMDYVNSATQKIEKATPNVIGATVVSISSILLFIVFTVLDTFFLLLYRRRLLTFFIKVFGDLNSGVVREIAVTVQFIIQRYIVGLLLEMGTVALICCTTFLILGIKYAILLGLITALFNIVPYLGIFTALAIDILITFATTALASKVILVVIVVVSVHLVDSNLLLPLIVGSKVRINAFVTLLGIAVGELLWGISGMFLSLPVLAIAKIIFDKVESLQPWSVLLGEEKLEGVPRKSRGPNQSPDIDPGQP